jgi:hypothetical protein
MIVAADREWHCHNGRQLYSITIEPSSAIASHLVSGQAIVQEHALICQHVTGCISETGLKKEKIWWIYAKCGNFHPHLVYLDIFKIYLNFSQDTSLIMVITFVKGKL